MFKKFTAFFLVFVLFVALITNGTMAASQDKNTTNQPESLKTSTYVASTTSSRNKATSQDETAPDFNKSDPLQDLSDTLIPKDGNILHFSVGAILFIAALLAILAVIALFGASLFGALAVIAIIVQTAIETAAKSVVKVIRKIIPRKT